MRKLTTIISFIFLYNASAQELGVEGRIFFLDTISLNERYVYLSCHCFTDLWFLSEELIERSALKEDGGIKRLVETPMLMGSRDIVRRALLDVYRQYPELRRIRSEIYEFQERRISDQEMFRVIQKCTKRIRVAVLMRPPARYVRALVHNDYLNLVEFNKCFKGLLPDGSWHEVLFEIPPENE